MLNILNLPRGSYEILGFFVCFRALQHALKNYAPTPSGLKSSPPRKTWLYQNISVSFVHSFISAILSVYCFFDEPVMLTKMLKAWSNTAFYLVTFCTGYFIHDFFDMLMYDASNSMSLLIHHVLVCMAFSIAVFSKMYIAFAVCSLLMEVNSVFLHLRQLLNFHGVSKTCMLYRVVRIVVLMTFVCFRFLTSAWMTNFVIQHRNDLPFLHFLFSATGMAIISGLNIQIFMAFWRAEFRRNQNKQRDN